jgi:hypothetical protein
LDIGSEKVMLSLREGVYGLFEGSGRGPWIDTTSRVDGDDVSRYADPGADGIRLARMTSVSIFKRLKYKFSSVQNYSDRVSQKTLWMKEICMRIKEEQDTTTLDLESAVGLLRSSSSLRFP